METTIFRKLFVLDILYFYFLYVSMKLKMCELILCQGFIILIHKTSYFINKFELIISLKKNSWYFYKILVSKISKFDDSKSRVVT